MPSLSRTREADAEKVELRSGTELLAAFLVRAEGGKPPLEGPVVLLSPDVSPLPPSCDVPLERAGGEGSGCKIVHGVM